MKTPRSLAAMLVLGLGMALHADFLRAQDEPTTKSLAKSAGFWKSSSTAPNGEEQLNYEWHVYVDELDMVVHWSARVNPESKEVVEVGLGYFGVRGNPGQVRGLFFSSTGMAAEVVGTLTDTGMFGHGHGALPGNRSIAADLRWTFDNEEFMSTFLHMVGPDGYSEQGYSQTLEKLDYSSFRDFIEGEGLVLNRDAEPAPALAPLARLVGRWEVVNDQGENELTIDFRYRAHKRWLFERWSFASGARGMNISGTDPASGRLALWSVSPNYIGRSGRWDVVADNTLGQVQGTARLVREFTDADTFAAHWQDLDLQKGAFVDRDAGGYVAQRASRGRPRQASQAAAGAARETAAPEEERASTEGTTRAKVYATVGFMEVPEGGDELYRQVESVWKRIHQARKDAGLIRDWVLLKVQRNAPGRGRYQYVTLTVADSLETLRSYDGVRVDFSPQERQIMSKTGESRTMLGVDVWELEMSALPSRRPQDASPTFLIGYMKSKDETKHFELERDIYRKVWREHAKAGDIWNWSIWRRRSGEGLHAENPPFNMISIVSFPRDSSGPRFPRGSRAQAARAAFPEDTPEQRQRRLGQADEVRDMYAFENWTVVDYTGGSNVEAGPDEEAAAANWRDEEWSKLVGAWRAPLENGAYRIKRISKGKEILEVYDAEGKLQWKTQVTMTIDRHHGLNFFTVTDRVQLHPPSDEPLEGTYTSIYKVHNGKWYEQLRGIFADNRNLAPDAFLIYERVEE